MISSFFSKLRRHIPVLAFRFFILRLLICGHHFLGTMTQDALVGLLLSRLKQPGVVRDQPDAVGEKSIQEQALEFEDDFKARSQLKMAEIEAKLKFDDIVEQFRALKEENDKLTHEKEHLGDKIAELQNQVGKANLVATDLDASQRQEMDKLEKENSFLRTERDASLERLKEVEETKDHAEKGLAEAQAKLTQAEHEKAQLSVTCSELETTVDSLKKLETNKNTETIRQLEAQLKDTQETIKQKDEEISKTAATVVQMEKQLTQAKDKEEEATNLADEATTRYETAEEFHQGARREVQKLQEKLVAAEDTVKALSSQLEEAKKHSDGHSEKHASLEAAVSAAAHAASEKDKAIESLTAKLSSGASEKDLTVLELQKQLHEAQEQAKSAVDSSKALEKQLEKLRQSSAEESRLLQQQLDSQAASAAEERKQRDSSTAQSANAQKEKEARLEAARKVQEDQVEQLKASLVVEKEMFEERNDRASQQISSLKAQLEEQVKANKSIQQQQSKTDSSKVLSTSALLQIGAIQASIADFRKITNKLAEDTKSLKAEGAELETLQATRSELIKRLGGSSSSASNLHGENSRLAADVEKLKSENTKYKQEILLGADDKARLHAEIRDLQVRLLNGAKRTHREPNVWFFLFLMTVTALLASVFVRYARQHLQQIVYGW